MIQVFSKRTKPQAYPMLDPTNVGIGAKKYYFFEPIEYSISPDGKAWVSCYDVPELDGILCYRAPDVQPANPTDTFKKVGLMDGQRLLSTSYDTRQITMQVISSDNIDEGDAELGYDALQRYLVSRDPYWISFSNWPQRMYYVKAKLSAPTFTGNSWTATVTFTDLIGLSRSINTSTTYQDNNGFGNNMLNSEVGYTFTDSVFEVYNQSDVLIDPERRGHPMTITCEGNSGGHMRISNLTTGDVVERTGATGDNPNANPAFNGIWKLTGVRPTLNGKSDLMQMNDGVITLQPGFNHIKVENFTGKITFDFPFWWLS